MKTAFTLLTLAYILLLIAFVMAFPYAKRGYDDMVVERAGVAVTAQIGAAILEEPSKPRGLK